MFRLIAIAILPLLAIIWQTLTEAGSGAGGDSSQGSGSGGGQTGGAGSSGSGGGTGASDTGGQGQDTTAGTGFEGEFNPEQARALINKLRPYETQAAQLQAKLADAETQLTEYQQAGQTELEQATTKAANLEADKARLQQEVRQLKVRVWGGEVGILDTEAASALLKWEELGEEPDEETTKAALKHAAQHRPALLTAPGQTQAQRQTTPDQTATNAGRTSGGTETQKIKPGRSRILAGIKAATKK